MPKLNITPTTSTEAYTAKLNAKYRPQGSTNTWFFNLSNMNSLYAKSKGAVEGKKLTIGSHVTIWTNRENNPTERAIIKSIRFHDPDDAYTFKRNSPLSIQVQVSWILPNKVKADNTFYPIEAIDSIDD